MVVDHAALVHPGAAAANPTGVIDAADLSHANDGIRRGLGVDLGALARVVDLPPVQRRQLKQTDLGERCTGRLFDLALAVQENEIGVAVVAKDFKILVLAHAAGVVVIGIRWG